MKVNSDTPVTEGTRARLNVRPISGIAYITLEDKGTDTNPLVKKPGQQYPVIETMPSLLMRLETALTQLSTSFQQLSTFRCMHY